MTIGIVTTRTSQRRSRKDVLPRINGRQPANGQTTAHDFRIAAPPSAHARAKARRGQGAIATSGLIEPPATIHPSLAW
jgi:hypothetical protein